MVGKKGGKEAWKRLTVTLKPFDAMSNIILPITLLLNSGFSVGETNFQSLVKTSLSVIVSALFSWELRRSLVLVWGSEAFFVFEVSGDSRSWLLGWMLCFAPWFCSLGSSASLWSYNKEIIWFFDNKPCQQMWKLFSFGHLVLDTWNSLSKRGNEGLWWTHVLCMTALLYFNDK